MTKQIHNPSLIWGSLIKWIKGINPNVEPADIKRLRLTFDSNGKEALHYINQNKLYLKESGKHSLKLPNHLLENIEPFIQSVYIENFPMKGETYLWNSKDEFFQDLNIIHVVES
jgi:hypothetical protein